MREQLGQVRPQLMRTYQTVDSGNNGRNSLDRHTSGSQPLPNVRLLDATTAGQLGLIAVTEG